MSTNVYFKLKDGRRVKFGYAKDVFRARQVKSHMEQWIADGVTVSVTNARGETEDFSGLTVVAVELADDPTPPTGCRLAVP